MQRSGILNFANQEAFLQMQTGVRDLVTNPDTPHLHQSKDMPCLQIPYGHG